MDRLFEPLTRVQLQNICNRAARLASGVVSLTEFGFSHTGVRKSAAVFPQSEARIRACEPTMIAAHCGRATCRMLVGTHSSSLCVGHRCSNGRMVPPGHVKREPGVVGSAINRASWEESPATVMALQRLGF